MRMLPSFSWRSLVAVVLLGALLIGGAGAAYAQNTPVVHVQATAPGWPTFVADRSVTLTENYQGPVFVAGGEVELTGTVKGDLVVAGGTVRIRGTVFQDVYAAGGTVIVEGKVAGNVVLAGGEVQFTETSEVVGSTMTASGNLQLNGTHFGPSWLAAEDITIRGSLLSDVHVMADEVRVTDQGRVTGKMTGETDENVSVASTASVAANYTERRPEKPVQEVGFELGEFVGSVIWNMTTWSALVLILVALMGKRLWAGADVLPQKLGRAALHGSVLLVLTPIAMILLVLTIVGLRAAAGLFLFWFLLLWLGPVLPMLALGRRALPSGSQWLQALLGAALLGMAFSLPLIGWVIKCVTALLGAGVMVEWLMQREVVKPVRRK